MKKYRNPFNKLFDEASRCCVYFDFNDYKYCGYPICWPNPFPKKLCNKKNCEFLNEELL